MSSTSNQQKVIVALVGSPNTGKTTLFNQLTDSKFKTVNYPGATVEYSVANIASKWCKNSIIIMDTPGTYSLNPKSADEEVTQKALFTHPTFGKIKKVISVVDSTQLSRHLLVTDQLIQSGFEVIVALTMPDLLLKTGYHLNLILLEELIGCRVFLIQGIKGHGIQELVNHLCENSISPTKINNDVAVEGTLKILINHDSSKSKLDSFLESAQRRIHFKKIENSVLTFEQNYRTPGRNNKLNSILDSTRKWDKFLLHPIIGLISFLTIMLLLFSSIFWMAQPFMDLIDNFFSGFANYTTQALGDNLFSNFIGNGVITSFGAVLVFVPQIYILFFGISILESSGYLARAATIVDKPLSYIGLGGRSFVPMLSGFACAIPAIISARNIGSLRDRLITIFIIPLLTCSARLPVYALLLAFLFKNQSPWKGGLALTAIYIGSLILSGIAARIISGFIPNDKKSFFMMELPLYRMPQWKFIFQQTGSRAMSYVKRAGPPIFIFALIIWVATTFPNYHAESDTVKLSTSYAGQLGKNIEPIFKPMGADWRVGVSLISAFAAREVFASSLAVIFNASDENSLQQNLLSSMENAVHDDGTPLFTFASVVALIIFIMIALQCTATTAIVLKETNNKNFAMLQLVSFNLIAYVAAVLVFQLLK